MSATGPNLVRAFVAILPILPRLGFVQANRSPGDQRPKIGDAFLFSIDDHLVLLMGIAIVHWVGQLRWIGLDIRRQARKRIDA
jgi:hypothetical protein